MACANILAEQVMKVIYLWTSQPWMNRSSWMELVRRRCQLWLLICGVLIRQGFIATIESKHAEQRRRKRSRNKAPSIKTLQALLDQKKKVCFIIKSRSCFAGNSSLVCNSAVMPLLSRPSPLAPSVPQDSAAAARWRLPADRSMGGQSIMSASRRKPLT